MGDVQVPVAAGDAAAQEAFATVEHGASELAEPSVPAVETGALPDAPPTRGHRFAGRALPAALRRGWQQLLERSQSPRVLAAGTVATVLLGAVALTLLLIVGFGGVGTHNIPAIYEGIIPNTGVQVDDTGPHIFFPPPLIAGPPAPGDSSLSESMADSVLQPVDLSFSFNTQEEGSTGADLLRGLLGSYHVVYARPDVRGSEVLPGTLAVLSVAVQYRDEAAASADFLAFDLSRLALVAGLPGFQSEPIAVEAVSADTTAVHMVGNSFGIDVGAYVVLIRRGAYIGIVALAAARGSESLDQAVRLADAEDYHLLHKAFR